MSAPQFIPILEILILNLITFDRCCERKYTAVRTVLINTLFTATVCVLIKIASLFLPIRGDGNLLLGGFIYLLPLTYLYRENIIACFIVMCTTWVYTTGILSLAMQISGLLFYENIFAVLVVENLLILATAIPFYRRLVPKFVFILKNQNRLKQIPGRYLALNNCLSFISLALIHAVFLKDDPSLLKTAAVAFLLGYIFLSYDILYMIVMNSFKMNRLEHEAMHDPLTGLANRSQLWQDLDNLMQNERTFSVLFMDLDRFKQINDRYGHITGDQYLKHFAEVASDMLGTKGILYRFGGDEFVAVYYGVVPEEVIQQLTECREWENGAPCPFNQVSTGFLICRPPFQTPEQILHQVDELMYQNKLQKGNAQLHQSGK